MNSLQLGVAPKMKPISPKRAALVAALDVGTSKTVCVIARLEPIQAQDVLRRRTPFDRGDRFWPYRRARHEGRQRRRS